MLKVAVLPLVSIPTPRHMFCVRTASVSVQPAGFGRAALGSVLAARDTATGPDVRSGAMSPGDGCNTDSACNFVDFPDHSISAVRSFESGAPMDILVGVFCFMPDDAPNGYHSPACCGARCMADDLLVQTCMYRADPAVPGDVQ